MSVTRGHPRCCTTPVLHLTADPDKGEVVVKLVSAERVPFIGRADEEKTYTWSLDRLIDPWPRLLKLPYILLGSAYKEEVKI